jgi:hypothetical protein
MHRGASAGGGDPEQIFPSQKQKLKYAVPELRHLPKKKNHFICQD